MNYYNDVEERIKEYQPNLKNREELYNKLHLEELRERKVAKTDWDIVNAYDALCDIVRTAYGISKEYWDEKLYQVLHLLDWICYKTPCFKECRQEVKRSNRTKSKDTREDWKILKGENYQAPDLKPIIRKHHLHCKI